MAEWKKVIVSGSQAELNSLDLKGSSGNLVVEGNSTLGNNMSDKTEITGSLNVTGSSIFSGENAKITIDPDSTSAVIDVLDVGGGSLELIKMRSAGGGDQIRIRRNGGQNSLELLDNGANSILLDSNNDGFYLNNFAIGANSADANNTLSVTGNAKITNGLTVSGSTALNVTGSSFFQGTGIFSGSSARVTIDPYSSDNIITIKNSVNSSTDKIVFLKSDNTEMASLANRGTRSELVLKNNGADSIKISNFNNSFHAPNFAIGDTSEDTNNTLSVTGNIKATTGITGSYLTNDNILVAGSAGEVESSGVTWNGTTLDLGAGNITSTGNLTIEDARINGDLVVAGTASFENTENLKVTDRFISLASGSTGAGDGGIVIQQASSGLGEVFGFDNADERWGLRASFDPTASLFTPTDFMVTTVKAASDPAVGTSPTYGGANGHGNMHVNTSTGDIFIYA